MGRAPCCEKMGLKRGPWTPEEDQILTNYINQYGHSNWRALPKQAGLLRCGKSCRLRWTNYLRPDIKRGNFTKEEEDTIINLHEILGNRWSAIAARLPGRTDNEIKNVWHTHLKKRSKRNHPSPATSEIEEQESKPLQMIGTEPERLESPVRRDLNSPEFSSSEVDSFDDNLLQMDESFWSEVFSHENSGENNHYFEQQGTMISSGDQLQFPFPQLMMSSVENIHGSCESKEHDGGIDFWLNLLTGAADLPDLPLF